MAREFTADDRRLFNNGEHENLYRYLGAHMDGSHTVFRVWAPNADRVSVVGDWNGWDPDRHPLHGSESGVWEGDVAGVGKGDRYKFVIFPASGGRPLEKADPFAFHAETPPLTASIVWELDYRWHDDDWMTTRAERHTFDAPMSIYECHLGSWSRQGPLEYVALAKGLADHLERTGFTHIELMPVMEHPFAGSWGYQSTGYFAPTSRFGTPQGLMEFVDIMHQRAIGVIFDWVPSHFAVDAHGLARFDGTHLYEHSDPRQGFHPDWGSFIFNYGRNEVRAFLLSSAHYWMDMYHADGLRVDGVASMLYLDYSRKEGEWIPNTDGGRENLEAVSFVRKLNASLYGRFGGIQTIAEESTAWPLVTRPTDIGGLGFGYKWDMGWMNDTLRYFGMDPIFRSYDDNHRLLTFRGLYAFTENYVVALSHDEVVHGKRSLLGKQPGDEWRRFAGLRALLGYQWALPGKKLLFMGGEIGSPFEWNHEGELPFFLLDYEIHAGVLAYVAALNSLYRNTPALHVGELQEETFQWIEADDIARSTIAFLRSADGYPPVLVVCNFTPEVWEAYRVGVPVAGTWTTQLCSDDEAYGGSGGAPSDVVAIDAPHQGQAFSFEFDVPPMSITFFAPAN
ncbi:MAG: 1,4-alpha-glucan branching protein GlgB [Acidimicrobiia bacterium]